MHRIIRKAGLEPWPKTFQNLRSTRETELAEQFPMHVVCKWIGNSQPVAAKHYLQLTDEHFAQAISGDVSAISKAAQNAAQKAHEDGRNDLKRATVANVESAVISEDFDCIPANAEYFTDEKVPCTGLEPVTC